MIFVDTSFFAALLLPKDPKHLRATQAVEELAEDRLSGRLRHHTRPDTLQEGAARRYTPP